MKTSLIVRCILLLIFVLGLAHSSTKAQTLPLRIDISGYRGNVIESPVLTLLPADTLQSLSVTATYSSSPGSLTVSPQPTLIRSGLSVKVRFASSANLPNQLWYRLYAGGQTRFDGYVNVSSTGLLITPQQGTLVASLNSQLATLQASTYTRTQTDDLLLLRLPVVTVANRTALFASATGAAHWISCTYDLDYEQPTVSLWTGSTLQTFPTIIR